MTDGNFLQEKEPASVRVKKYSVAWSAGIALHKVVRIKHVTRATVNEVLLAGVAGAIRALLQGCGVRHPPDLKASRTSRNTPHYEHTAPTHLSGRRAFFVTKDMKVANTRLFLAAHKF